MLIILGIIIGLVLCFKLLFFVLSTQAKLDLEKMHRLFSVVPEESVLDIYRDVEDLTGTPGNAALLCWTSKTCADSDFLVPIPEYTGLGPFSGATLQLAFAENSTETDPGALFTILFNGTSISHAKVAGRQLALLRVPGETLKNGKKRNIYSLDKYLKLSSGLQSKLARLLPSSKAKKVLSYLIGCGLHHPSEHLDLFQIGGSPVWVQNLEVTLCPECSRRMSFILQFPDCFLKGLLHGKDFGNESSVIYIFACKHHPHQKQVVVQYY